jgi:hypothetical protein
MIKKSAFAYIIFLLASISCTIAGERSYDNAQVTEPPNGWFFGGDPASFKVGVDSNISQHGKICATLESIVENPPQFCTLMQSFVVKNLGGQRVKMTGYIKSQGEDVSGSMWIRVDDTGNKIFADFDNMMDRPVAGNSDWTKCEIIFDVAEKCMVSYGFILTGKGKIWVDNVSFETVSSDIIKTAQSLNEPFPDDYIEQLKKNPGDLPEKPPVNLDFEDIVSDKRFMPVSTDLPKAGLLIHLTRIVGSSGAVRYEKGLSFQQKLVSEELTDQFKLQTNAD